MAVPGKGARIFLLAIAWVLIFPSDALAYLDPGTGSLVIQSLIAVLASVGYGLRLYWSRIRLWFKRSDDDADSPPNLPPIGPS